MPSSVPRTAEATNGNVMVAYDLAESDSEGEFGALPVYATRARETPGPSASGSSFKDAPLYTHGFL